MKTVKKGTDDFISFLTVIFGLLIIGIMATLLVRLQRGFLGLILTGIAIAILSFWLKELRSFLRNKPVFGESIIRITWEKISPSKEEKKSDAWPYDIFDEGREKVLVARVPGPEKKIKIRSKDHKLKIIGGGGFSKVLIMPEKISISKITYRNGVLQVKFRIVENGLRKIQRT